MRNFQLVQLSEPVAPAETIRRIPTKGGLWGWLRENLPEPPSRPKIAAEFSALNQPETVDAGVFP